MSEGVIKRSWKSNLEPYRSVEINRQTQNDIPVVVKKVKRTRPISPITAFKEDTCKLGPATISSNIELFNENSWHEEHNTISEESYNSNKLDFFEAFKEKIEDMSMGIQPQIYSEEMTPENHVGNQSLASELWADTQILKQEHFKCTDNIQTVDNCPDKQQVTNQRSKEDNQTEKELFTNCANQNNTIENSTMALKLKGLESIVELLRKYYSNKHNKIRKTNVKNRTQIPRLIAKCNQPWQILSRYIDIAIEKALKLAKSIPGKKLFTYRCTLCNTVFTKQKYPLYEADVGIEILRSHLNCNHLYDKLLIKIDPTADTSSVTLIATKVSKYNKDCNEKYFKLLKSARREDYLVKKYSKAIVRCLPWMRHKRILSYKCYECEVCYERYSLYIEHLRSNHNSIHYKQRPKITLEMVCPAFVNVIAYRRKKPTRKMFPVVSNENPKFKCLHCKADFDDRELFTKHVTSSSILVLCPGCHHSFDCFNLDVHIGQCVQYRKKVSPKTCPCSQTFQSLTKLDKHKKTCSFSSLALEFPCVVCPFSVSTQKMLLKHQYAHHTVPSDEFVIGVTNSVHQPTVCTETIHTLQELAERQVQEAKDENENLKLEKKTSPKPQRPECTSKPLAKYQPKISPIENCKKEQRILIVAISQPKPAITSSEKESDVGPLCPYTRAGQTLDKHMVHHPLVQTDSRLISLTSCKLCTYRGTEAAVLKHTLLRHKKALKGKKIRRVCVVCFKRCKSANDQKIHMLENHYARSDEAVWQSVTRCTTCQSLYPGPDDTHYCPLKADTLRCFYCDGAFQNSLFLKCHLKGQHTLLCIKCNKVIKSCMKRAHRALCNGVATVSYKYECGYVAHQSVGIEPQNMDCYSTAEATCLAKQSSPLPLFTSVDPRHDRAYDNGSLKPHDNEALVRNSEISSIQDPFGETGEEAITVKEEIDTIDITEHALDVLDDDDDTCPVKDSEDGVPNALQPSKLIPESSLNKVGTDKPKCDTNCPVLTEGEFENTEALSKGDLDKIKLENEEIKSEPMDVE